ncbi:MAG: VCBS repeat-containing protein [Planctomycetota bacterium]
MRTGQLFSSRARTLLLVLMSCVFLGGSVDAQLPGVLDPISENVAVPFGLTNLAFGDVNLDGLPDIVAITSNRLEVRLGLGGGIFAQSGTSILLPNGCQYIELADLDGDNDLDAMIGANQQLVTRLNDGFGVFAATGFFMAAPPDSRAPALGDVDLDGKLDLALPALGFVQIHLGDGTGAFSANPQVVTTSSHTWGTVLLVDLDGDSDLDLVSSAPTLSQQPHQCSVRLNLGSGIFAMTGQDLTVGQGPYQIRVADVNVDGVLDLVVANSNDSNISVRMGIGGGQFANSGPEIAAPQGCYSMAVGDLDNDGAVDLVSGPVFSPTVLVQFGDGSGGFTAGQSFQINPSFPLTTNSGRFLYDLHLYDIDLDGDLDLGAAMQHGFGNPLPIYRNGYAGFLRGDNNLDGAVNLSDPIGLLYSLFGIGQQLLCLDAADANDDGALNLTDPLDLLYALFGTGSPLPAPITSCGYDTTIDALQCDVRDSCP